MKTWRDVVVAPEADLRQTIRIIDAGALQIALVVDASGRLLGTVTDGDIRRGILNGLSLEAPVSGLMNRNPTIATAGEDREGILSLMKQTRLHQIPVVSHEGELVGLETMDALLQPQPRDNIVLLMAGGLGTRLRPLTEEKPKPMLHVGDRPILETILKNFVEYGFRRFYFSVNYKAEVIEEHFGNGSRWGVDIRYLREFEPLGTAGALSLLPESPAAPVVVMNGDILTRINLDALLDFHARSQAAGTVCVREFINTIPYGVVRMKDNRLVSLVEKPKETCFVSAGIYVIDPQMLRRLPGKTRIDMPALLQGALADGLNVVGFPIHEYWMDIGRAEDFERAHSEYRSIFQ